MARCLPVASEANWSVYDTPELDFGSEGRFLRTLFTEYELDELVCWGTWGRGTLAKRLSSELVSVEDGRVDVDPCWPLV